MKRYETLTWDALSEVLNLLRLRMCIDRFRAENVPYEQMAIFVPAGLAPELTTLWGVKVIHHKYLPDNSIYIARLIPGAIYAEDDPTLTEE